MIVKFFTRGAGSASGVFDYLLKDRNEPDGQRQGAELLRGDVVNQSLLIDSLDFKQKYTSGCLSFAESADQVTQEQKEALMNGFEETIRAGLDSDRIAVSWIEHRDKGRLELNFVFANVDLKHGRAFQPYVHSQDKKRVNAWKDMQNIKYGFKDPSDPINKRLLAQRDNLPRDVKQARQLITEGLTALVAEGVIKSRDDVIQALTDGGFEIARETPKAISIKNPNGNRNIRLTGGLYERDFNFSKDIQAQVRQRSREYQQSSRHRYNESKRLYDSETARKREYHQGRHSKPKRAERAATADVTATSRRYTYSPIELYKRSPSPYKPSFKRTHRADADRDRELRTGRTDTDRTETSTNVPAHQIRQQQVGDNRRDNDVWDIDSWFTTRFVHSEESYQADRDLLRATSQDPIIRTLQSEVGNSYAERATRTGAESTTSTARHDRATKAYSRQQRQGYSSLEELIAEIDSNADRATAKLADTTRELEEHHTRAERSLQWLDNSTQNIIRFNEQLSERHNKTLQRSNSAHKAIKELSEYDSTRKQSIEQYRAVREQVERIAGNTERNRQYAERNQQVTTANTEGARLAQQLSKQVTKQLEQQRQQVRASQSYSPRMR